MYGYFGYVSGHIWVFGQLWGIYGYCAAFGAPMVVLINSWVSMGILGSFRGIYGCLMRRNSRYVQIKRVGVKLKVGCKLNK